MSRVSTVTPSEIQVRLATILEIHKVVLLVDDHTIEYCYPKIAISGLHLLSVPIGDDCKDLSILEHIWQTLYDLGFHKSDYLITLGGGALSDLGGLAAATYMRGMRLIHIPTTLLGMIDASIGGKVAINFSGIKNLIGTFYNADEIFLCSDFWESLPKEDFLSGCGEMLKYALLMGGSVYASVMNSDELSTDMIERVIAYKLEVTTDDPLDKGKRQYLNLGHTTAHAFEALYARRGDALAHGIAVVAGIIVALYVSYKTYGLEEKTLMEVARFAKHSFTRVSYSCHSYEELWQYAIGDKKKMSDSNGLTMILLEQVGRPVLSHSIDQEVWYEALDFYQDFM